MNYQEMYETMLREYRRVFETLDTEQMQHFIETVKNHTAFSASALDGKG